MFYDVIAITGQVRFAIAGVQVMGTLFAMGLGGVSAAVAQERRDVDQARSALVAANHDFQSTLQRALDDGTPSRALEPLAAAEWQVWSTGLPRGSFIDRLLITDLHARAHRVQSLTSIVNETQRGVELDLAGQVAGAVHNLDQDIGAAHAAGLANAADYDQRMVELKTWAEAVVRPKDARSRLGQVNAVDTEVKDATAAKIAADKAAADAAAAALQAAEAALRAARANAAYQHDRAHADLDRALAIRVLQVADIVAAVTAIDTRQTAAQTTGDFNSVAADFAYQARRVEDILFIRSNTYTQLARARTLAARTASLGVDVSSYVARLDAAHGRLDAAPDTGAMLAVADTIRDVTTGLDGAYANALAHPPPPPGSVILNVPFFAQIYSLSCEEAALQMALAYEGINQNQDAILGAIGVDRTPPQVDGNGNVVHWGDPYANFVGDPNGYREGAQYGSRSGYGTYYTTIARVATGFGGHVVQASEGIKPSVLYDAVNNHHPSVVWVAWEYSPHPVTTYQAFDGRVVMYGAPWEHAVTLVGMSPGSVLINNPHSGQEWVTKATFEHAYEMFNQMAVILQ
jgi:uncharacterized protein YvpB